MPLENQKNSYSIEDSIGCLHLAFRKQNAELHLSLFTLYIQIKLVIQWSAAEMTTTFKILEKIKKLRSFTLLFQLNVVSK